MKEHFLSLKDSLGKVLHAGETLLCSFSGERSDFVRFNHARVRQAGSVEQGAISIRLIRDRRQASAGLTLSGNGSDLENARKMLERVRGALDELPEDPWILINETPRSSSSERRGRLPSPESVIAAVSGGAQGLDLVGFYAGGTMVRGFASSLGQENWHEVDSFSFDWSLYREADQAVKTSYAGFDWDDAAFEAKLAAERERLGRFAAPQREIAPGEVRAYLAPRALDEIAGLLSWGGFSARARATRQSPLLRMQEGALLSPKVSITENTEGGVAPGFQGDGFIKPAKIELIREGALGDALISPRSAKEYGLATNAAGGGEAPQSLDLAAGTLAERDALAALDTGLYISNLWYLNYSDRPAGRITGMTRFATFWVEGGRIVVPVKPLRFDDSLYRMLGEKLVDLTAEREMLLDPSTYGERSTASARLPGVLLSGLRFTL
ncbi:MAG TPA: metallopeptidase TldD-related protein [Burkholderiales bacterium]|nr:metallopeptidase TldD-related protein [Burkholderiales bacterium]